MNSIDTARVQQPIKRIIGRLEATDGTIYSADNNLQEIKLTATGQPLATSMVQIEAKLLGEHKIVDTKLTALAGTYNDTSNEFEYTPIGVFNVLTAEYSKDEDTTKIVAYDNMVLFQVLYFPVSDYPTTLYDLLTGLCAAVGVQLSSIDIYNGSLDIPTDYWADIAETTFRDVLKEICEVSATSARINAAGELEMVPLPTLTGQSLTYDNLLDYKFSDDYGAINTVVLSRQPQNDDVVLQDDEQVNYPMTKNILDLETAQITYTMDEGA